MTTCRLGDCDTVTSSAEHLLCETHWKKVPKAVQQRYYQAKWQADHGRANSLADATHAVLEAAKETP